MGGGGVYNAAQSAHVVGSVQYGTVTEVQQHDWYATRSQRQVHALVYGCVAAASMGWQEDGCGMGGSVGQRVTCWADY